MVDIVQPASVGVARLTAALVLAQRQFQPAIKESINPHFRSRYVDLAGVINSCREALGANGLAVVQTTAITEHGTVLRSILLHISGEQIISEYPLVPVKNDPQGMGSAVTYARRYSLMALLGIAAEDDDGERSHDRSHGDRSGNAPAPRQPQAPVAQPAASSRSTAPTSTPKASVAKPEATQADLRQAKANMEEHRQLLDQAGKVDPKPKTTPEQQPADPAAEAKAHEARATEHWRALTPIDGPMAKALWKATSSGAADGWHRRADAFEAINVGFRRAIELWGENKGYEHIEYVKQESGWPWGIDKGDAPATPEQVARLVDLCAAMSTMKKVAPVATGKE